MVVNYVHVSRNWHWHHVNKHDVLWTFTTSLAMKRQSLRSQCYVNSSINVFGVFSKFKPIVPTVLMSDSLMENNHHLKSLTTNDSSNDDIHVKSLLPRRREKYTSYHQNTFNNTSGLVIDQFHHKQVVQVTWRDFRPKRNTVSCVSV